MLALLLFVICMEIYIVERAVGSCFWVMVKVWESKQ